MTITKELLQLLGGKISFESKQGEGTIFRINISFRLSQEINQVSDEIKNKSINAYKLFAKDVRNKKYPSKKNHIKIDKKELKKIKEDLN